MLVDTTGLEAWKTQIDGKLSTLSIQLYSLLTQFLKLYAPSSFWNKKLSNEPINVNSPNLVAELWQNVLIAGGWINTTSYSTPLYLVDSSTPKTPIYLLRETLGSVAQELLQGVKIPPDFKAANGGDGHACIIDLSLDKEYDFWQVKWNTTLNRWEATNAGILQNVSTSTGVLDRLPVWNSATATHLPLAGGLILKSEVERGVIPHCLAFAINRPTAYPTVVAPALTTDGSYAGANSIPEGTRFRFPSTIIINPNWTPITKMLVIAIRDYGMVVRDKTGAGANWYVQDPTQFGLDQHILDPYLGGKPLYQILGDKNNVNPEFPWNQLEALA